MATTTPPAIDALPAAPDPNDRSTFNARAYPWSAAQGVFGTQIAAVAANVKANADDCKVNADIAADQAVLATTNGEAQVELATAQKTLAAIQAGLAATNGAEQVALATAQKTLAAGSAATAITQAGIATTKASEAEASRIAASKLNLGNKTSAPAVDNQGDPLLAGATYYDTALDKWRVWTGLAWGDGISAISGVSSFNGQTGNVTGVSSVNGQTGAVALPPPQRLDYEGRNDLRSQTPAAAELAIIDGLGLFAWESGSTEPDDDESCFATASGRWLLQAASYDLWAAINPPAMQPIYVQVPNTVLSISTRTSTSISALVFGALVGDFVAVSPFPELGVGLAVSATVTSGDSVSITITNPDNITTGTCTAAVFNLIVIPAN